jgi:hypothetical protein
MPSTYSLNTGLELIATGEKSGSWGSITNGNLEILDAAINGGVTVSLTGEGASYDLDTSDWLVSGTDVSEGQYKLITLTGGDDPGAGNRITLNIVADATGTPRSTLEKLYFIRTSSLSYGVEISTGTGASKVNIDDGDFKIIFSDGSDEVISLTDDLTASSVKITGGSIDGTPIGATTASTAVFSSVDINAGTVDNTVIGGATPAAADFTAFTVNAAGSTFTVSPASAGTLNNVVVGGVTAAAATFTTVNGTDVTASGNLQVDGNTTLGSDDADTVTINADIASSLVPSVETLDLGAVGSEWRDLYVTGTANIDSLVADTADINGGTVDGATIGGVTPGDATFNTMTAATVNATTINASNFYESSDSPTFNAGASTFTCDATTASLFYCSHNATGNIEFVFTNVPASGSVYSATIIHNYYGASSRTGTSTYPGTTLWPNGTQPAEPGPGESDLINLFTYDGGTTWYAGLSGINMS